MEKFSPSPYFDKGPPSCSRGNLCWLGEGKKQEHNDVVRNESRQAGRLYNAGPLYVVLSKVPTDMRTKYITSRLSPSTVYFKLSIYHICNSWNNWRSS